MSFRLDNFNQDAKEIIIAAKGFAKDLGHENVEPWHLFASVLNSENSFIDEYLKISGVDTSKLASYVEKELSGYSKSGFNYASDISFSGGAGEIIATSIEYVNNLTGSSTVKGDEFCLHILKSLRFETALNASGFDAKKARQFEIKHFNLDIGNSKFAPDSILSNYCVNLTEEARNGLLDPVIGRDSEIREAMNILQRRTQNNPVFVGEAGVGKSALVNGLANRMTKNEVPETMKNKELVSLDLVKLCSGGGRSEVEKRTKQLIKEMSENPDVILFIDDIHQIVGGQGSMSEALIVNQLLKPALARGEFRCIGATSDEDYKLYVERDQSLERRFQKINVDEPTVEEAVGILRGLKETYSSHHQVDITDASLVAAVNYAKRFISSRSLPSSAIDLLDSAAARVRTTLDSTPEELEKLERSLIQLKIQRESLKDEEIRSLNFDEDTRSRLDIVEKRILEIEKKVVVISEKWQKEKEDHANISEIRTKINSAQKELATAASNNDLVSLARLKTLALPKLESELKQARVSIASNKDRLLHDQVEDHHIAEIVSTRTGIPLSKMNGAEQQKIVNMEEIIGARVIGQPEAVTSVSDAIMRSRAGLSDPNKPIGSFLFLGPTGVGKTELTKQLTEFLFDNSNAVVRVDMSEFMEKHTVSRLIGAPPGYAGYEEGGFLTEAVKKQPYSVVLFDEVEKAHPDIFNILLQVLDEGHLTDGRGRTVDFKNTVIIMTSNLGANDIQTLTAQGQTQEVIKESVMEHVKGHFRPEFINRLDDITLFRPLDREAISKIAKLQVNKLLKRIKEQKINADITPSAIEHLAEVGFDPLMGARPLTRAIQDELQRPLSKLILTQTATPGSTVIIDAVEGKLNFNVKEGGLSLDVENEEVPLTKKVASRRSKVSDDSEVSPTKKSKVKS